MVKNRTTEESIIVGDGLVEKVNLGIEPALAYETATHGKRKLDITGEVGEILVCYRLGFVSPHRNRLRRLRKAREREVKWAISAGGLQNAYTRSDAR